MASMKAQAVPYPSTKMNMDYEDEDNHRHLMRAAEILADKVKMKGVARHMLRVKKRENIMRDMLTKHAKSGSLV